MGEPVRKSDKQYTYGDYARWPEDERWELIEGEAWNMSPAPGRQHQLLVKELIYQIEDFLRDKECEVYPSPFDVLLPEAGELDNEESISTVVQPDISVVCDPGKLNEKGCTGAPDWIIEIVSPYSAMKDFDAKRHLYERHGVREYWIVDPGNRFVHVYLLDQETAERKGDAEKAVSFYKDPIIYEITSENVVSKEGKRTDIPCTVLDGLAVDLREVLKR